MTHRVLFTACILFLEISLRASVSIVQNGDFESGNKSPWYAQLEAATSIVSSNSFSGSFSLFADNNPKRIYQDITSTRAGDFLNFTFNVFSSVTGTNTATPILVMWLYSASGDNQYSFNLQKDVWQEINMNSRISQISPSTVINKIGFYTYGGFSQPGEVDTYYDSFNITSSIPEPSFLSLLALGGVVVALRRRNWAVLVALNDCTLSLIARLHQSTIAGLQKGVVLEWGGGGRGRGRIKVRCRLTDIFNINMKRDH